MSFAPPFPATPRTRRAAAPRCGCGACDARKPLRILAPRMTARERSARIPILYVAPWVDYGGSDKGTIDWFRWIDRDRFAPLLATTQPSENRRLAEIEPYAEEIWPLPDLIA